MPAARVNVLEIYYEVYGEGAQTLVMIRGLGSNLTAWYAQVPEFQRHFRTVAFDNRGAGRTSKPDAPYSISAMAADTAGLMDALGIKRAAVLGISMGGMIAQELAINYGDRISALILGCTHFGGARVVPAAPEIVAAVVAGESNDPVVQRNQLRAVFCDETLERAPETVARHERMRRQFPIPAFAFARQVEAIRSFDAAARLRSLTIPTMVVTGREDRLVPPRNSSLLATTIPGAVLREMPGGHLFFVEYPDAFNRLVIDFVRAHP